MGDVVLLDNFDKTTNGIEFVVQACNLKGGESGVLVALIQREGVRKLVVDKGWCTRVSQFDDIIPF